MSERAVALAEAFEAMHAEVVQAVARASAEQWAALMADEQWPAGFGFYHIAEGYELVAAWIGAGVGGGEPAIIDPVANDARNAGCLAAHRDCSRAEVMALLKDRGPRLAELVRGLSDEQLARDAVSVPDGTTRAIEQVAAGPMLGHLRMHLASIKAATGLT